MSKNLTTRCLALLAAALLPLAAQAEGPQAAARTYAQNYKDMVLATCIANAYSSNHELIQSGKLSTARKIALHGVDAVGLVHALLLRIQALVLPIQTLVFSGH